MIRTKKIETRYGRMTVPRTGDLITKFLVECGEWAFAEARFLARLLPEHARVLDLGAYLGTFGLGLSQLSNLDFVCFVEPNPEIKSLLASNIKKNLNCNFKIVNMAVGPAEFTAECEVHDSTNLGSFRFVTEGANRQNVRPASGIAFKRLSDIQAEYGPFDLIKIDAEGMELPILQSAGDFLISDRTMYWTECNDDPNSLAVADHMLNAGFKLHYFAFPSHSRDNFKNSTNPIFPFAYEAGILSSRAKKPTLRPDLPEDDFILRTVDSEESLRKALWDTPRWGRQEWLDLGPAQLVANMGRELVGQEYRSFLRTSRDEAGSTEAARRASEYAPVQGEKDAYWQSLAMELRVSVETLQDNNLELSRVLDYRLKEIKALDETTQQLARLAEERLAQIHKFDRARDELARLSEERLNEIRRQEEAREQIARLAQERLDEIERLEARVQRLEIDLGEVDRKIYDLSVELQRMGHAIPADSTRNPPHGARLTQQFQSIVDKLSSQATNEPGLNAGGHTGLTAAEVVSECLAFMSDADRKIYNLTVELECLRQRRKDVDII